MEVKIWKKKDFRAERIIGVAKVVHLEDLGAICRVQLFPKQNRSLFPSYSCFHFIPTAFDLEIISLSYMSVEEKHPVVTKYTLSKIPNGRLNYWAEILDRSYMWLQGCSWRAAPAISERSKPFEWLIMYISNKIYSFEDSQLPHKLQSWNIWRILQVSSRMQLTGSSSNLWALQTLWMTNYVS